MSAHDTQPTCRDCGGTFDFTDDERRSFATQGHFHPPSRCATCREARKTRQSESGARTVRPAFRELSQTRTAVVCSDCGEPAIVPFAARAGRTVYCSNCFRRHRGGGPDA